MTMSKEQKQAYAKMKNGDAKQLWLDTIKAGIESNNIPWRKPWKGGSSTGMPENIKSKRAYRGGNIWGLWFRAMAEGWTDLRFGTRKNLIEKGYSVKGLKNGTGCPVAFYKPSTYQRENEDGELEEKYSYVSRWYEVWCVEQCEDYEAPAIEDSEPATTCEMMDHIDTYVLSQDTLSFTRGGHRAFYSLEKDSISLPIKKAFESELGEVMTAFHEAAHSTGHGTRLGRNMGKGFGSSVYAFEELVAELTSMLTVLTLGGDYDPTLVNEEHANSMAYLKHWLDACDIQQSNALSAAFSDAQKASDYILETLEGNE